MTIEELEAKIRKYEQALEFAIENGKYADKHLEHLTRGDWGNELRKIAEEGEWSPSGTL